MQVDPFNLNYTSIQPWSVEDAEDNNRNAFEDTLDDGKVAAIANSRAALKKLQDDLRKVGYKKLR